MLGGGSAAPVRRQSEPLADAAPVPSTTFAFSLTLSRALNTSPVLVAPQHRETASCALFAHVSTCPTARRLSSSQGNKTTSMEHTSHSIRPLLRASS
jgi:hypothetical protein